MHARGKRAPADTVITPMLTRLVRRAGIRARSVVAATVVVALAYSLGASLFVGLLQKSLLASIDSAAVTRVNEVAVEVSDQGVSAVADDLAVNTRGTQIVQVLDPTGRVVLSSSSSHPTAMTEAAAAVGKITRVNDSRMQLFDINAPYIVVILGADHDGTHYRVVVASSVDAQRDSVQSVLVYLVAGLPVVLIAVAFATWILVGRALAPVDEIRAKVDGISASELDQRVPIPPTGDAVARLAITMNQLLGRLETSQVEQRQFVGDASHELRSPLATVLAALELAEDDAGQSWTELQPLVLAEAQRMQRLVDDLLLLARSDERGLRFDVVDVDVDDILAAEVLRVRRAESMDVTADVSPLRIQGDLGLLSQTVRNLVDNAVRAASRRVELSAHVVDGSVVIRVDDDGPGVPPSDRRHVFGRFVRLDDSRERTGGGSGLGLAIVERLVHAQGGSVSVLDSPLGGARFEVRLPYVDVSSADDELDDDDAEDVARRRE